MARSKPPPENGSTGTKGKKAAGASRSAPDRHATEDMRARMAGASADEDALHRAQDLIYDAFEEATARRRVALARKALKITPLCADAYVLLAGHAAREEERLELYRLGVEAGERALGEAAFEEDVGHFWGILETRPYMRARHGLAQVLWELSRHEEAVEHYRELLRLNPNDNQGLRYLLAACYLELGRDSDLAELLQAYEEASVEWTYAEALVAFRRDGDGDASRRLLSRALESNRYVPAYLLGERRMPKTLPAFISLGGEDEAVSYVSIYGAAWAKTPGALDWLGQVSARPSSPRPSRRPSGARGPKRGGAN